MIEPNATNEKTKSSIQGEETMTLAQELQLPVGKSNQIEEPRLNIFDFAAACGVTDGAVEQWILAGKIQVKKENGRRVFDRVLAERIRRARELFGRKWHEYLSSSDAAEQPETECAEPVKSAGGAESTDEAANQSEVQWDFILKMLERARRLDREGKRDAAIELVWAALEESGYMEARA